MYPDGTVVINGNNGRFIGKGEGVAGADLGRTVTTVEGVVFPPACTGRSSPTSAPRPTESLPGGEAGRRPPARAYGRRER